MSHLPFPALHLVTSRARLSPDARTPHEQLRNLEAQIDDAIDAGIDLVQVREPDLDAGPLFTLVQRVVARAAGTGTRILVNERADVAAAAGADGVHLPSRGFPEAGVRSIRPDWFLGRSVHAHDAVDGAALDYLLFGTVFASESKAAGAPAAGLGALAAAVRRASVPVVAIGGITPEVCGGCRVAGASGVAAIGVYLPVGRARDALGVREGVRRMRAAWLAASAT